MLHLLLILLLALATTSRAATTNTMASVGTSVAGNIPYYTDTSGQLLAPLGTDFYASAVLTPWLQTNGTIALQWKKAPQVEELLTGSHILGNAMAINSGSTTTQATTPSSDEAGVSSATTGTLTNGMAGWRSTASALLFTTNAIAVDFRIRTPAALSTDADGYQLVIGIGDATSDNVPTDGAYFFYTHATSNGVWTARTANSGALTFASGAAQTPPTVAVDTWYDLHLEGTSSVVNFWVSSDNGASWQWIGYTTANIPSVAGRETGVQAYIRKIGGSVGTTARIMNFGRCVIWPSR